MNKVVLMGRLTTDPDVRYTQGENPMAIARYTLAVDRPRKKDGEQEADFIRCVTFGRSAEFTEKYFHKGIKIVISGHIQTGSFTNKEGQKVYTTDVVVENQEFAESKGAGGNTAAPAAQQAAPAPEGEQASFGTDQEGFMNIPDGIEENLPFV